jgi:hypothetical protein
VSQAGAQVRAAHRRGHARPRAQPPRALKAGDVADLGDHEHRNVARDAADLAEHLDVGSSSARASISRAVCSISREKSSIIARQTSTRSRGGGELELRKPPLGPAAQSACRPTSPDHAHYLQLKERGLSHPRTSLTISRKLARRCYHTLRQLGPAALEEPV